MARYRRPAVHVHVHELARLGPGQESAERDSMDVAAQVGEAEWLVLGQSPCLHPSKIGLRLTNPTDLRASRPQRASPQVNNDKRQLRTCGFQSDAPPKRLHILRYGHVPRRRRDLVPAHIRRPQQRANQPDQRRRQHRLPRQCARKGGVRSARHVQSRRHILPHRLRQDGLALQPQLGVLGLESNGGLEWARGHCARGREDV